MKARASDRPAGPAPTTHTRPIFAISLSRVAAAAETSAAAVKEFRVTTLHRNPRTPDVPQHAGGRAGGGPRGLCYRGVAPDASPPRRPEERSAPPHAPRGGAQHR